MWAPVCPRTNVLAPLRLLPKGLGVQPGLSTRGPWGPDVSWALSSGNCSMYSFLVVHALCACSRGFMLQQHSRRPSHTAPSSPLWHPEMPHVGPSKFWSVSSNLLFHSSFSWASKCFQPETWVIVWASSLVSFFSAPWPQVCAACGPVLENHSPHQLVQFSRYHVKEVCLSASVMTRSGSCVLVVLRSPLWMLFSFPTCA